MKPRMLIIKCIPFLGASVGWLTLLVLLFATQTRRPVTCAEIQIDSAELANKRPVFFSEYKLRSTIESLNEELRELKRNLMRDITHIYFHMKSDSLLGFRAAQRQVELRAGKQMERPDEGPLAFLLMAHELAQIVLRKFIIQRRLLAGLKLAFVKFLPMDTLRRLHERFQSYSWLKDQNQVDLRPMFAGAKENQYVQLYNLIELRARVRAADDVLTLSADNMARIVNTIQMAVIDRKLNMDSELVAVMTRHANRLLEFYSASVIGQQRELDSQFEMFMGRADALAKLIGGPKRFLQFLDKTIDMEALDIDLSNEAHSLELPPTINNQMILNNLAKWTPRLLLDSMDQDRLLLMGQAKLMKRLFELDPRWKEEDIAEWTVQVSRQLCGLPLH